MTDLTATITRLREWLESFLTANLDEIAADGGVTVGMVYQQEARTLQVPRLTALLDALEGKTEENKRALKLMGEAWGSLNFILAFYEPRQTYLDTNAWKQAEASARRSHAALRAWLDEPAHAVILQHEDNQP